MISVSANWGILDDCVSFDSAFLSVDIEIANIGSGRAGFFGVAVGPYPSEFIDEGLEAGESLLVHVSEFLTEDEGVRLDQQLGIATVDYLDQVQESNESNNSGRVQPELPIGIELCAAPEPVLGADLRPIPLLPPGQPLNFVSIDMIDASRGWGSVGVGEQDQHVVRTEDGGRAWIDVSPPELSYGLQECGAHANVEVVDATTAWVGYETVVDPSADFCWLGPVTDVWKTEDGGRTWQLNSFVPREHDAGGIPSSGFPEFEFLDSKYGWALREFLLGAGSTEVELYMTSDGGLTWQLLPGEELHRVSGFDFLDLKHGWATISYESGYLPPWLAQTHNGGSSWEYSEVPPPADTDSYSDCELFSPAMRSPTAGQVTLKCETDRLELDWFSYETVDSGQTWEVTSLPGQPEQLVSASVGWKRDIAPEEEQIETDPSASTWDLSWTFDAGQSWSKFGTVELIWGGNFDFINSQVGWAVTPISEIENALIQTRDGGRTWQPVQPVTADRTIPSERGQPPLIFAPTELQALTSLTMREVELLQELPDAGVTGLAVYPPYDLLLTSHQDGTVTLWGLTGAQYGRVFRPHSDWVYDLVVAEVGGIFVTASKDGRLRFWLFSGPWEVETFTGLGGEVSSVATSPGGHVIASAGQDGAISVWQLDDLNFVSVGPPVKELVGHAGWVWDLALSPDFLTLASGSVDRTIRLWNLASGEPLDTLTAHNATVGAVAFSPDGSRLASAAWDGSVILWDTETWLPVSESKEHGGRVYSLHFSPDGSLLASGGNNGELILWSAANGEPLRTLQVGEGAVRAVLFTPDGRLLLTGSDDGYLGLCGVRP